MNEIQTSAAPAKRLGSLAQNVAMLLVFLLPILFLPMMPFAYGKVVLLACASIVPLIIWGVARLREGTLMYPSSYVLWLAFLLPVVYLVSALLSGRVANSIVGAGYETDTLVFVLLLVALLAGASLIFTSIASVAKMLLTLGASFGVLAFVQITRLIFGAENIFPSIFSSEATTTLLGSWNDLAIFSGLMIVVSLAAIVYAPRSRIMQALTYLNLAMALFLLVVVNLKVVWVILALLSLVLFVYFVTTKKDVGSLDESFIPQKKRSEIIKMVAPVAIFVVSILFVFAGNAIGSKVSGLFNVQFVDVRPSWEGTIEVAKDIYADNAILGTGPNTFINAWNMHKPAGVNNTAFWNIDFRSGIGLIPTAFITVGLVGGILWLLFLASVVYTAFRTLWARTPNDTTRFVVFATAGGALYLLVLLVVYVPQSVMLALTFFVTGLFLAIARNVNAVKTRKVSTTDSQATSFVFVLTFTSVAILAVSVMVVTTQRVLVASLLERSARSAQNEDFERAGVLAQRASSFAGVGGIFGSDDRPSSILAQLGVIKLREVLKLDSKSEGYKENLQSAIEGVILPARSAIEASPANYNNHVFLARIYEQLSPLGIDGAYDAALASYALARNLNPTNPSLPLEMARSAFVADKLEDAQKYALEALALKRNYTDAYFLLSQIAIKSGNIKEAIATTESAVILAPNNPGLLFQLGVLQYSAKDYVKALPVFERAIALNKNYANALYYLGLTNVGLDKIKEAIVAFKRVEELNPDNEEVKNIINFLETGDTGELQTLKAPSTSATTPVSETQ